MKDLVREAVESVLGDDLLWDELVGRIATESPRPGGSVDGPPSFWRETAEAWQRRPGVSAATSAPTAPSVLSAPGEGRRVRFFSGGEMYEAALPAAAEADGLQHHTLQPEPQRALLSLLAEVERGRVVSRDAVDRVLALCSSPDTDDLWNRMVEDGAVVPVAEVSPAGPETG
jgi:hypothetical protein